MKPYLASRDSFERTAESYCSHEKYKQIETLNEMDSNAAR